MTYQVLARKWRPRTFSELIGQEHVVRALVNALDQDRIHHAFLFTGTRGVGKTTLARVFAKALNCLEGVSSEPCGKCSSCQGIDEGRFFDLIEVDAASRTKVDDTRELLENVQYAPTNARYKVYLIDEVHMLTTHSFNALLKTLEEPPAHVKFLLATTDPQKLPVTVLSRCLQFNLKRLSIDQIADYLVMLAERESFEADGAALRQLAVSADGSMRDALSLLDQAVAYGAGVVKLDDVQVMLGTVHGQQLDALVAALCAADGASLWQAIGDMVAHAPDYGRVLGELAQLLHRAALAQTIAQSVSDSDDGVARIAAALSPADVQLYYQIAITGRRDLDLAPDHQTGFEMTLLRMLAFQLADEGAAPADVVPPATSSPPPAASPPGGGREAARRAAYGSGADKPVSGGASVNSQSSSSAQSAQTNAPDYSIAEPVAAPAATASNPPAARVEQPVAVNYDPSAAVEHEMAEPAESRADGSADSEIEELAITPADAAPARARAEEDGGVLDEQPPLAATDSLETRAEARGENAVGATTDPVSSPNLSQPEAVQRPARSWDDIIQSLALGGTAGVLANNSLFTREDAGHYVLALDPSLEHLHTSQAEDTIRQALGRLFGTGMKLRFEIRSADEETPAARREREQHNRQKAAQQSIESDPLVKTLKEQLGAQVVPGSVRPLDS